MLNTIPARWAQLLAEINDTPKVGQTGVRDVDAPCIEYLPTVAPPPDFLGLVVTASGHGTCDSDGHYLCVGCQFLSQTSIDERRS